ncbi:MAG: chorismate mutase [Acidobacteria bacterium]|nr:chorismate mutase [Acidobacteriota bacterium]
MALRALRGATTLDADTREDMTSRVVELLETMFERNDIAHDDVVSVIFTATADLTAMFPAEAARKLGIADIPLMCAAEIDVDGATQRCVRVMMHLESSRTASDMRHVYLRGAKGLRDDLPE